jgi:ribosomal RNA-processing protein 1
LKSDRKTREHALDSLRTFLQRSTPFSELDFMKLWKGLFFCMWHSDKPLTQQRLARDLADLLTVVSGRENFLGFVRAFWQTIAREWAGIDALRMDKFLYLVRCYVGKGFEVVRKKEWEDEDLIDAYLEILAAVPLNPSEQKIPNGLRYHVIDVYVDELDKVDTERNAPLEKMLEPLKELGEKSLTKPMKLRVKEALEDERLQDWKSEREQDIDEGNDGE